MIIGKIEDGIVLDHITAGRGMEIYRTLHLDELDCSVAMITNADSVKMGRKDIIKIGRVIDINLDVLGFIDPGITVNIIRGGKLYKRERLTLPKSLKGVLKCKNPRCITTVEPELVSEFRLSEVDSRTYRCIYCEALAQLP
ncbi:MAG TPA: aspartate carbamoyltransferase regulatory subunit [Bacillota bacterium]|nr:aspartate carbamoyltransferase regulatory subunit [Clostridiales bacterium]HPU17491.1 aspartate carbamoyltransferase regulatory subunit [Bacillota bacterium]